MRKTIVLRVFDWDKIAKAEGIGEVKSEEGKIFINGCLIDSLQVQIPLWQINLQGSGTDEWTQLHKLTGTEDKVSTCVFV